MGENSGDDRAAPPRLQLPRLVLMDSPITPDAPVGLRSERRPPRRSWLLFFAWALGGTALVAGLLGGFGILIYALPVGALTILGLILRGRTWPEALGVLVGLGALALALAIVTTPYVPCPPRPSGAIGGVMRPGDPQPPRCSVLDTRLMYPIGAGFVLTGVVGYAVLRRGA